MPLFLRTLLLLVFGFFVFCAAAFGQQSAKKIADVGETLCDYTKGYLDHFSDELHKDPAASGYIIFYGGRTYRNFSSSKSRRLLPKRGEAEARVSFWKSYLVNTRDIDPSRIEVICGGYRQRPVAELWIAPSGATAPKPTPTLRARDIRFRRGKPQNRDMFGEDDCHFVTGGITTHCR